MVFVVEFDDVVCLGFVYLIGEDCVVVDVFELL